MGSLKKRLKDEGSELVTNCNQLKMTAQDGKKRLTDVANTEQILRIIQSIPSKKAEPFKVWLAQVGRERIEEVKSQSKDSLNLLKIAEKLPMRVVRQLVRRELLLNEEPGNQL